MRGAAGQSLDPPALFATMDANGDGVVTAAEAGTQYGVLFSRLVRLSDANGDGALSAQEFVSGLTPPGRPAGGARPAADAGAGGRDALIVLLARMDANADGVIAADEVPADMRTYFNIWLERVDADKNRQIVAAEIQQQAKLLAAMAPAMAGRMQIDVPAELAALPDDVRQAIEALVPAAAALAPPTAPPLGLPAADGRGVAGAQAFGRALDVNADGVVAVEEAVERLTDMVSVADVNHDAKLDDAEVLRLSLLLAIARQGGPRTPAAGGAAAPDAAAAARLPDRVAQLIATLDADGDGQLNAQELPPPLAQALDRIDRDASGAANGEELEQFIGSGRAE